MFNLQSELRGNELHDYCEKKRKASQLFGDISDIDDDDFIEGIYLYFLLQAYHHVLIYFCILFLIICFSQTY